MLATRHDLRLGLHRLRLAGELTEIRAADLRFTLHEARALFDTAGIELSGPSPGAAVRADRGLGGRDCGWRRCRWPGIRTRSGSPRSFPAVNARWPSTCWPRCSTGRRKKCGGCCCAPRYCERVNGELADLLTGGSGGERILQDLEQAGAFVVALDARRSWFRYHQLFADLLQLELRRQRTGRTARAARRRRRVVRRARVPGRGGPARPGGGGLGPGRPAAARTTGLASGSMGWAPPHTSC